ncbi:MAG: DUF4340 domain-containing protein [Myxococcaceae bacterium]|nr:DUF4340 domain-containing protein [Myxococcaceae bacterium]
MKARGLAVQGALAAGALVAAYATWQGPKETTGSDAQVTVVDASKSKLDKVRYEDGRNSIELFKKGERFLLTQASFPPKPLPTAFQADAGQSDGGAADAGVVVAAAPEKPKAPRTVYAGERAEKLYEKFTPFEASRALGVLAADKLKEVGLEGSERKLTVTVSGQSRVFTVSKPDTATIGTYLRDEKSGEVFLMSGVLFAELEPSSAALVERRLHAFKAAAVDELTVTAEGSAKTYLQKDADIPATTKLSPKDAPDKPDELARNWHDKVWSRLIVTDVLGEGELPEGGEPKVAVRIDYRGKGETKGFLELAQVGKSLFARSENTVSWVGLHAGADDLLAEAKKIAGGK